MDVDVVFRNASDACKDCQVLLDSEVFIDCIERGLVANHSVQLLIVLVKVDAVKLINNDLACAGPPLTRQYPEKIVSTAPARAQNNESLLVTK